MHVLWLHTTIGHDTCSVIMVHACIMIIVHALWSVGGLRPSKTPCFPGVASPPRPPAVKFVVHEYYKTWYMFCKHTTCMYYDHNTCMYYNHSTCLYYDHWGACGPPNLPASLGGLAPQTPPPSSSSNMSPMGHDTCSVTIVHASERSSRLSNTPQMYESVARKQENVRTSLKQGNSSIAHFHFQFICLTKHRKGHPLVAP